MIDALTTSTITARIGLDLPAISRPLMVRPFEDRIEDGFGLIRTDTSPPVEVAVIHDGTDSGIGEAADYARLLKLAPVMLALLTEALGVWVEQFDGSDDTDPSVSGADVVEWFAAWRLRVRSELADAVGPS